MRIGGFQGSSLIDYPGNVSAVIFTIGCNFRCPYCHNPELVLETPEREIPSEEIIKFLDSRKGVLPAVVITGGEPTMHDDLPDFARRVKSLGYLVKLDTNGTNPAMLRKLIGEKHVDYVAMDIKAPREKYPQIVGSAVNAAAIRESIDFLLSNTVDYEFRTTIVRSQLSPEDLEQIGVEIAGARRYFLQEFLPGKTLHPAFRNKLSYGRGELENIAESLKKHVTHCEVR
ncbi:anaerobic ribonucleoside-triphosphate reductase activating protein [Candidatus Adlerbacteria bacterium RIFCSPHIGHO2_01_FULL_54_23]|uniref:Anaerobic ribonucleoside-triphosphate reductase activating protein n=3 Tax=Candidatus Adleribacteriota TaxID=1752736 RepID=A0A1F4Y0M2_9BACT|nr:MAG: Anaerobic ribonucleoside-triphosphate reductase activating protein [Candidatus Adlerbacteria bacterium GW2011_GWA1_54_10]KKW36217.1 MAG: Anaerobic ribonucleoside-triphosphate reductase activating protein [Candidatus Adlerbacteria bacterium GW2011_GWA2_54_12]KKW37349.1 MAG: Anaerobic ribonucleoside-triphosphate reductase activating protein [Candidatus Adlerbacteria bacterium GW2011_GWB1_54_7]OGC79429.1 MAG: anaerobic ribonucleoside-triphosphate reductase activating protein [Candidatus Adl